MICTACNQDTNSNIGWPYLTFKELVLCSDCYRDIVPAIYRIGDCIVHYMLKDLLASSHNRKNRRSLKRNKELFNSLLNKYNFKCQACESKENLTIDHIHPVSKGGSDDPSNLQILCKSCNSKKGSRLKWIGNIKEIKQHSGNKETT